MSNLSGIDRAPSGEDASDIARKLVFGMPTRFDADAARGVDAIIQFIFSGDRSDAYYVSIKDQKSVVSEGTHAAPTVTLTMPASIYIDVAMGRITGQQAFFQRKLRFAGDMSILMKMHALFPSYKA